MEIGPRSLEIARAFIIEADVDFEIAKIISGSPYHSRTIYFAQQAVEKIVKASLALKGIYTTDHNLSSLFSAVYRDAFPDMERLVKAIDSLERHGAKVRFPLYHRPNLPLWIPSLEYREEDAQRAIRDGEYVYKVLKAYLESQLPEPLPPFSP